jgi:RND superfamily putative drug exporter
MLNQLGKFITRNRWWVIGVWVVVSIAITAFSPKLSSVTSSDQTSFLPGKYESSKAQKLADKAFPQSNDDTEILLVTRKDGGRLTPTDVGTTAVMAQQFAAAKLPHIVSVTASPQSVSKDGKAQMVQIVTNFQSTGGPADGTFVDAIRGQAQKALKPTDLQGALTGQIAESADSNSSFNTATKIVTIATFLLVIILPGVIFRSPVAAFAPVLAVTLVYTLAQSLTALAAQVFNFKISNQLSILYTVVLFGIGTDYILFLLFRYREKLRGGERGRDVVAFALSRAGEAILSAALVVASAFAALGASEFGIFKNLAPGLVICVLTMLLAVLTLIPAVVAVIGPKIFWPSKSWQKHPTGSTPRRLGHFVGRRPALVTTCALVLLLALAVGYPHQHLSFDFSGSLPQNSESVKAANQVTKLFSAGAISPTQVFLTSNSGKPLTQAQIQSARNKIDAIKDVKSGGDAKTSKDGKTALITVFLPGDPEANSTLDYVQNTFRPQAHAAIPAGTTAYVTGESAAFVDVRDAVNRDLRVILPVAGAVILVILMLLLRSLLAPVYLLLATALGYTATLGGTVYLFQGIKGDDGLIFMLPIMIYIFVVAIGTDYNILTMTRLREEVRAGEKPRKAADMTIEHSSTTVASAGLILAGTFGSLSLAGISFLSELGFAIAFGIVLAAFCIAPLLVPSVAALLGYKVWWPGHRPAVDKNRM